MVLGPGKETALSGDESVLVTSPSRTAHEFRFAVLARRFCSPVEIPTAVLKLYPTAALAKGSLAKFDQY